MTTYYCLLYRKNRKNLNIVLEIIFHLKTIHCTSMYSRYFAENLYGYAKT